MAPIRRYLRITKYSVLECRIYLDNPALAQSWLLHPRKDVLSRVIKSVRPYVLPKLREERERSRKKSAKKKGIKDVVIEDDFEVSIFLTETTTRHSVITKHKHFHDTTQTKLKSTSSAGLIAEASDAPIDVDAAASDDLTMMLRREVSDDEDAAVALADIPAINETTAADTTTTTRRPKRGRSSTDATADADADGGRIADDQNSGFEIISDDEDEDADQDDDEEEDDEDGLFVQSPPRPPPAKRQRGMLAAADEDGDGDDDKKKLAMDISYEGFSIYGRVLCLVVKRRDIGPDQPGHSGGGSTSTAAAGRRGTKKANNGGGGGGQEMMESFIISTQVPAGTE